MRCIFNVFFHPHKHIHTHTYTLNVYPVTAHCFFSSSFNLGLILLVLDILIYFFSSLVVHSLLLTSSLRHVHISSALISKNIMFFSILVIPLLFSTLPLIASKDFSYESLIEQIHILHGQILLPTHPNSVCVWQLQLFSQCSTGSCGLGPPSILDLKRGEKR